MQTIERVKDIYDREVDRVYRTAFMLMKNKDDAEDIVQSVFLTLIEKDIEFSSQEHEKAWLIVTTRNRCKDVLKSYWHRSVELKGEDSTREAGGFENHLQGESLSVNLPDNGKYDDQMIEDASGLLMRLPEFQREVMLLHFYEGYTVQETAEMLGSKESKVRSAINSARKSFRRLLEK